MWVDSNQELSDYPKVATGAFQSEEEIVLALVWHRGDLGENIRKKMCRLITLSQARYLMRKQIRAAEWK